MADEQPLLVRTTRSFGHQSTLGVLLAGGSGSRFEGPAHKLTAPFRGRPLYRWGLAAVLDAGLPAVTVWGALEPPDDLPDEVVALRNARWREGMATTLQVAVEYARAQRAEAIVVGPADQPMIPASAWAALAASAAPIAVATYGGRRANPVRLAAEVWPLLPQTGDRGARELLKAREDLVAEVACEGNPADIDTREDLDRWT